MSEKFTGAEVNRQNLDLLARARAFSTQLNIDATTSVNRLGQLIRTADTTSAEFAGHMRIVTAPEGLPGVE
jgi:hypothetical protein